MAKAGFRPEDVTHILSSHLHIDHCGGHEFFPHALVLCHEDEYAEAKRPQLFERLSYSDLSYDPALEAARDGSTASDVLRAPTYRFVNGDVDVAAGVKLVETLGHSAGHYSLLVELAGRKPLLFTGDAAMTPRNLELMVIGGFHLNPVQATESLARLKAVQAEHDAELFFSHSMPEFETWRKSPEWYQ